MRPTSTSTLFPYTTLFRSYLKTIRTGDVRAISQLNLPEIESMEWALGPWFPDGTRFIANMLPSPTAPPSVLRRSEEHTSELQSLRHLVCRLLLEKKKI